MKVKKIQCDVITVVEFLQLPAISSISSWDGLWLVKGRVAIPVEHMEGK